MRITVNAQCFDAVSKVKTVQSSLDTYDQIKFNDISSSCLAARFLRRLSTQITSRVSSRFWQMIPSNSSSHISNLKLKGTFEWDFRVDVNQSNGYIESCSVAVIVSPTPTIYICEILAIYTS